MIIDFLFGKIIVLIYSILFDYLTWSNRVIVSCDLPEGRPYVEAHDVKPGERR